VNEIREIVAFVSTIGFPRLRMLSNLVQEMRCVDSRSHARTAYAEYTFTGALAVPAAIDLKGG
jgi:hypothetical protein